MINIKEVIKIKLPFPKKKRDDYLIEEMLKRMPKQEDSPEESDPIEEYRKDVKRRRGGAKMKGTIVSEIVKDITKEIKEDVLKEVKQELITELKGKLKNEIKDVIEKEIKEEIMKEL